jgi:hypothetical protein
MQSSSPKRHYLQDYAEIGCQYSVCDVITNSVALVRERTIPVERRRFLAKLVPNFADRGCSVVSAADTYGRNLSI